MKKSSITLILLITACAMPKQTDNVALQKAAFTFGSWFHYPVGGPTPTPPMVSVTPGPGDQLVGLSVTIDQVGNHNILYQGSMGAFNQLAGGSGYSVDAGPVGQIAAVVGGDVWHRDCALPPNGVCPWAKFQAARVINDSANVVGAWRKYYAIGTDHRVYTNLGGETWGDAKPTTPDGCSIRALSIGNLFVGGFGSGDQIAVTTSCHHFYLWAGAIWQTPWLPSTFCVLQGSFGRNQDQAWSIGGGTAPNCSYVANDAQSGAPPNWTARPIPGGIGAMNISVSREFDRAYVSGNDSNNVWGTWMARP